MFLEKLSNAYGPLGYEGEVRKIILNKLLELNLCFKVDRMGNIIVHKTGIGPTVMLNAHMDEPGFIITSINDDGSLNFAPLGSFYKNDILASIVYIGENRVSGVIGARPIHLQSSKEREEDVNVDELFIDIGAQSKKEAQNHVEIGDFVVHGCKFRKIKQSIVKGKAFRSRLSCYALIEILKQEYDCDLYGVFSVQGDSYMRGILPATYGIKPDIAINIDTINGHLEKGTYIAFANKNSISNREIYDEFIKISKEKNLKCVQKAYLENGESISNINNFGVKAISISIPIRYKNSYINMVSLKDLENTINLIYYYLKK